MVVSANHVRFVFFLFASSGHIGASETSPLAFSVPQREARSLRLGEVGSGPAQAHSGSELVAMPNAVPLALTVKDRTMTKDPLEGSDCQTPVATGIFLNTDSTAWVWFSVSGAQKGDKPKAEWFDPAGVLYYTSEWQPITWEGDGCLWAGIYIADSSPAGKLGSWSVKVTYSGGSQFTETFRILHPSSEVKVTVKNRMMTKDPLLESACQTPQPASSFLTTESAVWVWFSISGAQVGDRVTNEWVGPDNTLYRRFISPAATWSGDGCYRYYISVAGGFPATQPGTWRVRILYNSKELFTESFVIVQPIPPPEIKFATAPPAAVEAGTAVTLDASTSTGKAPLQFAWTVKYDSVDVPFVVVIPGKISFTVPTAAAGKKIVVSLTVTDPDGKQTTRTIEIQVSSSPQEDPAALKVGYAVLTPDVGQPTPAGTAVFSLSQKNILVSEAGVPSTTPTRAARLFAVVNSPTVNTGVAIANPSDRLANVSLTFTAASGTQFLGSLTIPARGHVAKFTNELFQNLPTSVQGVLNINSDTPVALVSLRLSVNDRGESLLTTLPVVDLEAAATTQPRYLPQIGDGSGITTEVILINQTSRSASGRMIFRDQVGNPLTLTVGESTASTFRYTIPAEGAVFVETKGDGNLKVGSLLIEPDAATNTPVATAVFRLRATGTLVTEAAVPAPSVTSAGRVFVETTYYRNTGLAIHNPSNSKIILTLKLRELGENGSGRDATVEIPAFGQSAKFVNELFPNLPRLFQGLLDITGNGNFAAITVRQATNERGVTLFTTLPIADLTKPLANNTFVFPHIGVADGLATELILINHDSANSSLGTLTFFSSSGSKMTVPIAGEKASQAVYKLNPGRGRKFRAAIPNTGVTDENGQVLLNVAGREVTFRFVDDTTGNPLVGMSIGVAIDPVSKARGLLLAIDPSNQYPLQLVTLAGPLDSATASDNSTTPLQTDQTSTAPVTVKVVPKGNAALKHVTLPFLPRLITSLGGVLDDVALVLKAADYSGVPLGDLGGLFGIVEKEIITPEKARAEILLDLSLGNASKALLMAGFLNPLFGVAMIFDWAAYAIDERVIFDCESRLGGQLEKITVKRTAGNISFFECRIKTPDPNDQHPTTFKAVDKDSKPVPIDDIDFLDKGKIKLGIKGPPGPDGVSVTKVPKGQYKVTLRAPNLCPKSVDVTVPEGGSVTVQFLPCPAEKLTIKATGSTGFLKPGATVNFTAEVKDANGTVVLCDPEWFVINPVGSTVATIARSGANTATATIGPDDGSARVVARCKGLTSNAVLVSGIGPDGPQQTVRLTVSKAGNGTGVITSTDGRINCGAICSVLYTPGSTVTLVATPGSDSKFDRWSESCSGTGGCVVTLNVSPGLRVTGTFSLTQTGNPVPSISGLNPSSAAAGGPAFTLQVTGTGFVTGSVVRWKGQNRTTTLISSTSLQAAIPASDIAASGTADVTVFNPAPGGGTSNAVTFTIGTAPKTVLDGDWAGTFTVTPTQFCRGTYSWEGTFQVSGGRISGSWYDSYNRVRVNFTGTFDGVKAKWSVQIPGDAGPIELETTRLTASRIEGTFTAPNCAGSGRIGGTFEGNKK